MKSKISRSRLRFYYKKKSQVYFAICKPGPIRRRIKSLAGNDARQRKTTPSKKVPYYRYIMP
ncbi:MAG: hypothetical protein DRR08_04100 [Candidatus Parabeggiatoa sp. nov. 2]|nr:MAG: hypothetical protein B6247_01810 [Beggiatoa sp. 4572_84]RKZ63161.1 MAG: hypothetical protein DRR08_04100 [Gammaproteobacteria bacterium]